MDLIDLGGSWTASPDISGSPTIVDAVEFRDRPVRWSALPLDTVGSLVLFGKVDAGGTLRVELWKVLAGVPDSAVLVDDAPITDTGFVTHTLALENPGVDTTYRLRATVTDLDGKTAQFLATLELSEEAAVPTSDCSVLRTGVANVALNTVGVTDLLASLATDDTVEAVVARLHFDRCVDVVLRDFPWGFATAYATLAWVAGSSDEPVNGDWTFAYRMPSTCVFARRVVRYGAGRDRDPNPPAFHQGVRDADGRLLFSNYADPTSDPADPTVELEFTQRQTCVVEAADELFREALAYLLASKLAPGLSKNKVTAADCLAVYGTKLAKARVASANEQQPLRQTDQPSWMDER